MIQVNDRRQRLIIVAAVHGRGLPRHLRAIGSAYKVLFEGAWGAYFSFSTGASWDKPTVSKALPALRSAMLCR
jgi:hypothetical protein